MTIQTSNLPCPVGTQRGTRAFSILEVMIAMALFFMCTFAILALVSQSLSHARNLRPVQVDASSALAELSLTNRLEEGPLPIEIIMTFEELHPGWTITGDIYEVATNGLFQIDFMVGGVSGGVNKRAVTYQNSVLLFRPMSQRARVGGRR